MENMDFKSYILEEKEKTAVFAFGRMNPPTIGHEKLVNKVHELAKQHKAHHVIVLSHSQDSKKNPLTAEQKVKHAKRFFPHTNIETSSKEHPSLIQHAKKLYDQGHKHLVMVAGSDRAEEYHRLLHKYNGKQDHYHFKSIKVVSAGHRDPDAEGAEGMSASKMREHAKSGNFHEFKKGIPGHVKTEHARELYHDVRHGMNLKESVDIRDRYINGEVYNLGDKVCFAEGSGEVVFKGPSYVTVELQEGVTVKKWIHEVKDIDEGWTSPRVATFATAKVPVILMTNEQKQKLHEAATQLSYANYTTSNMDECPLARQQLSDLISKADKNEFNQDKVLQAVMATDDYLGIEKEAKKIGFADQELVHDFIMKLSIAHDTLHMFGYVDRDLDYMKNHIKTMSQLSMHKDGTFSNEFGTHTPVQSGDIEEETTLITMTDADGKILTKKVEAKPITKKTEDQMKQFKKLREAAAPESDEAKQGVSDDQRDVNWSANKDVFNGIDKPEAGMFSFKSFMQDPEKAKVASTYQKDRDDVQAATVQNFQAHSPAYTQMRKAQQQGHQ